MYYGQCNPRYKKLGRHGNEAVVWQELTTLEFNYMYACMCFQSMLGSRLHRNLSKRHSQKLHTRVHRRIYSHEIDFHELNSHEIDSYTINFQLSLNQLFKINLQNWSNTQAIWYLKSCSFLTNVILPFEVTLAGQPALWFWHPQNWKVICTISYLGVDTCIPLRNEGSFLHGW